MQGQSEASPMVFVMEAYPLVFLSSEDTVYPDRISKSFAECSYKLARTLHYASLLPEDTCYCMAL